MSELPSKQNESTRMRRDYRRDELLEGTVEKSPITQFQHWFDQAVASNILEPNAMTLSTVGSTGMPSSRIVLLKGFDSQGFRFYSNYGSQKGQELQENPQAALCFFWDQLEREVRIQGKVNKLSREESEHYFRQRPRMSQLGAWASYQSTKITSRDLLEKQLQETKERFADEKVPLPDFWGGYLLKPSYIEFWQGRSGRLHDRICYEWEGDDWKIFRRSP